MPKKSEYLEYLVDMLQPLGAIRARSMFGGWGLYADERFFAIVAQDVLYFKVDDTNCGDFEACGLKPFRYETRDTVVALRYYPPPPEALDDREILCAWARKGIEAAERGATAMKPRKAKRRGA